MPEFCTCTDSRFDGNFDGDAVTIRCVTCGKPPKLHSWTPTDLEERRLDRHLRTSQKHAPGCTVSRRQAAAAVARSEKKHTKNPKGL